MLRWISWVEVKDFGWLVNLETMTEFFTLCSRSSFCTGLTKIELDLLYFKGLSLNFRSTDFAL